MGFLNHSLAGSDGRVGVGRLGLALGIIDPVQSRPQLRDMHLPDLGATGSKCRVGKGKRREAVVGSQGIDRLAQIRNVHGLYQRGLGSYWIVGVCLGKSRRNRLGGAHRNRASRGGSATCSTPLLEARARASRCRESDARIDRIHL